MPQVGGGGSLITAGSQIADGVISNQHIASNAAIVTAKIASYIAWVIGVSTAGGTGSPADSTTYYVSDGETITQATASTSRTRIYIPQAATIKAAYGNITVLGTLGTTENITIAIRLNDTTNTNITTTAQAAAVENTFNNTGLSISVVAGDYIDILFVAPAWVTNPTTLSLSLSLVLI
jgi:hypothetical protein